jgi:hypothetical protein
MRCSCLLLGYWVLEERVYRQIGQHRCDGTSHRNVAQAHCPNSLVTKAEVVAALQNKLLPPSAIPREGESWLTWGSEWQITTHPTFQPTT